MKYALLTILLNLIFMQDTNIVDNEKSFLYTGNWPINKNKESILENSNTGKLDCPNGLGCECIMNDDCVNSNCIKHLKGDYFCALKAGDTFPHFKSLDQFNEILDIYDFANDEGKYILIEMGASWCSPCHALAGWFTWNEDEIKSKRFWKKDYELIYDLVKNQDVYFITILYEDEFRDNATYDTAYEWYNTYPDEDIPILIDEDKLLHSIIRPTGIPAVSLIGPDMKIITLSSRGFNTAFDYLVKEFKSNPIKENPSD